MADTNTAPSAAYRRNVTKWGWGWGAPQTLFVIIGLIFAVLVLVPFYFVVKASLTSDALHGSGFTLENYVKIFSTSNLGLLTLNSIVFAIGSTTVSVVLGCFLAWVAERTNAPMRQLAYISVFAGFSMPGVVTVVGWILLLGPNAGLINVYLRDMFSLSGSIIDLYSMWGMIFVSGLNWLPVSFLLMVGTFSATDATLREAAEISGANALTIFYRIMLPLSAPSFLAVLILVLINNIESFETPALIGLPGGVQVLTTEIYMLSKTSMRPQHGQAAAYGVVLIILVSLGLSYYARLTRQAGKFVTISGKAQRPRPADLGKWRWPTTILVAFIGLLLVAPLLVMGWASLLKNYAPPSLETLSSISLDNYHALLSSGRLLNSFKNTLLVSLFAATATVLISAVASWVMIRGRIRWSFILDYLATLPIVFPSVVLGLAFLTAFLSLPLPLYGTTIAMGIAFITKYIPYGIRFTSAAILKISAELEDGAASSGAGWARIFIKILVPLMAPSLFSAWIYIMLLSMKELTVALFLVTAGTQVNAVEIFMLWQNGRIVELGAYSVISTLPLLVLALVFHRFSLRYGLK